MTTRPFVLVAASRLRAAQARSSEALREWRSAWGFVPPGAGVSCASASDAAVRVAGWRAWRPSAGKTCAWIRFESDFDECLSRALFSTAGDRWDGPARGSASLAAEVAQAAKDDLVSCLVGALRGRPAETVDRLDLEPPSEDVARPGSGAVVARCDLAGAVLHVLILDGELAATAKGVRESGALSEIVAARAAMSDVPVTIRAEVGRVEIDLGALRRLSPGDVLRLDTPIEGPLTVLGPEEELVCHGYLGAHDGALALDLIP